MKKRLFFIAILLIAIGCGDDPFAPEVKSAAFTVTEIEQPHYATIDEYGIVTVHYSIKNTGNVNIDYYKVWFKVTCKDGSTYREWTNGTGVGVGDTMTSSTMIATAGKQYTSVVVDGNELTSY